jgi:hypothetical protein
LTKAGTQQAKIIGETIDILRTVESIFPSRYDTLALQCSPLRGTDYDGSTRSGISDPTPSQAFELSPHHRRQQSIRDQVVLVRHHAQMLAMYVNGIDSDLDTSAIARQHRCSPPPEQAMESWVREECGELAVTRDGLCGACYQRRHHWQGKQIQGAA